MRGPFKVRVHTGSVPLQLDIDAESLASAGNIMLFYRGTRIAYVVGTSHLLDVRGEVEDEPERAESEPLLVADDDDEQDPPVRGEWDEPHRGQYL